MSTHAGIIVECSDGLFRAIYCHHDGYLDHVGRVLFDHYKTQEKAEALVALGDLSAIGEEIGRKHPWRSLTKSYEAYEAMYGKMCQSYFRDQGDSSAKGRPCATLEEAHAGCEHNYFWRRSTQKWEWVEGGSGIAHYHDLGDVLSRYE